MDKKVDMRDGGFPPSRKEHEPWTNEGGTARYPEGFKIRGHDANALLDRADGVSPPEPSEDEPNP